RKSLHDRPLAPVRARPGIPGPAVAGPRIPAPRITRPRVPRPRVPRPRVPRPRVPAPGVTGPRIPVPAAARPRVAAPSACRPAVPGGLRGGHRPCIEGLAVDVFLAGDLVAVHPHVRGSASALERSRTGRGREG